jgi:SNF2 family DNA or RNA helicase
MNDIKYANFHSIIDISKKRYSFIFNPIGDVYAGMYMLTLITKDGFAGLEELKKEMEEDELELVKRDVKRALSEKEEKERIRKMIKEAIKRDSII